MRVHIIRKQEQITARWKGGTTTQLFIYPEGSSYAERNFLFRISTATTETEESVFTELPGVNRKLMVLEGELKLIHEGYHTVVLKKYETDSFRGEWTTKGIGKVTDFNLMTRPGASGEITFVQLKEDETRTFQLDADHAGIYFYRGSAVISRGANEIITEAGDFVVFSEASGEQVNIEPLTPCECVIAGIRVQETL